MRILISGASIAGPALALWLAKYGFEPTVVEIAPSLRGGGQAVDFRGEAHFTVLERMGVLDDLRDRRTHGSPMTFVDERGRQRLYLPSDFAAGELEVLREDIAQVYYEHGVRAGARYVFGDSITRLSQRSDKVEVTFASGRTEEYDLVVGADGVHSNVRRLAFPAGKYETHLGYYVATWELQNYLELPPGSLNYNVPGRLVSIGRAYRDETRAGAFVMFKSDPIAYDRHDVEQQKDIVRRAFGDLGWETPRLLASLAEAKELYFDSISRVDIEPWSTGRVALVGDAACGATIGGMGTGTGTVAAYVLAGELARAGGDYRAAFERYEKLVRPYAQGTQVGGDRTGKFLAPATTFGRMARDGLLSRKFLLNAMLKMGQEVSSKIELPTYVAPVTARN
ncbi:2-polyprenyl-6-methoxyphenol hydroxylase-like FAD-dependent oxidoreductase [Hamadaea flava]|uniref:FAD-dependent monooxygenase n=1 Tax=Hamadaea flava TaxID=1742688 RepID=A0ABV8LWG9_9ACTN|nr:FAD-dependent monooxygenase [Hamadaea flava]MCP2324675.1 2-polyprenyl-6-methoxyphenol hydroxylase-like FAD-dependent oxidoreductase [Hamadaea flava]